MFKVSQKVLTGGFVVLLASLMAQPMFARAFDHSTHEEEHATSHGSNYDVLASGSVVVPTSTEVQQLTPEPVVATAVSAPTDVGLTPGIKPSIKGAGGEDDSDENEVEDGHDHQSAGLSIDQNTFHGDHEEENDD